MIALLLYDFNYFRPFTCHRMSIEDNVLMPNLQPVISQPSYLEAKIGEPNTATQLFMISLSLLNSPPTKLQHMQMQKIEINCESFQIAQKHLVNYRFNYRFISVGILQQEKSDKNVKYAAIVIR